jgi:hypothetical protein
MRFIYRDLSKPGDRRTLDMTPDGQFRSKPGLPIMDRIFLGAVVVAVIAGGFALSALAFWIALFLLPVALVAGLIAWGMLRIMSARRSSVGGQGNPFRRF